MKLYNNFDTKNFKFLIENQVVQIFEFSKELLLINEQTFIKLRLKIEKINYKINIEEYTKLEEEAKNKVFYKNIYIILFLLIIINYKTAKM